MGKHSVPRGEQSTAGKPNGAPDEKDGKPQHGLPTELGDRDYQQLTQSRLSTFLNPHLRGRKES